LDADAGSMCAGSINDWQAADIAYRARLYRYTIARLPALRCRRTNDRHPFNSARQLFFSIAMPASNDRGNPSPHQLEAAARAAMEQRAERAFTDTEWATMRARFQEFVGILRDWDRTTTASQQGNVEELCQREF
jgi:hypothetical protein